MVNNNSRDDELVIENRALREEIARMVRSGGISQRLMGANNRALADVGNNLLNQTKTVPLMTQALMRVEKSQLKSLSLGTTYNKFLKDNTESLKNSKIGFAETAKALLDNFDSGVRVNTGSVMKLTERMIATGQDAKSLNSLNSQLISLTGRNNDVLEDVNNANMDIADKYQISNTRLIDSLMQMTEVLDSASFFGSESVKGLSNLVSEIQGKVGVGMTGQIQTTLKTLMPSLDALSRGGLLGSEKLSKDLASGQASLSDLTPVLNKVLQVRDNALREEDPNVALQRARAQLNLSEKQFNSMVQLGINLKEGIKADDSERLKEEQRFSTLRTAQQKANNFFDTMAPLMYAQLVRIAQPALQAGQLANAGGLLGSLIPGKKGGKMGMMKGGLGGLAAAGLAMGLPSLMGSTGSPGGGGGSSGGMDFGSILGGAAQGAGMGLAAGPIGAVIGGIAGGGMALFEEMTKNTADTAKNTEDAVKEEQRKRKEERAKEIERQTTAMTTLVSLIRSKTLKNLTGEESVELARETNRFLRDISRKTQLRSRVKTPGGS